MASGLRSVRRRKTSAALLVWPERYHCAPRTSQASRSVGWAWRCDSSLAISRGEVGRLAVGGADVGGVDQPAGLGGQRLADVVGRLGVIAACQRELGQADAGGRRVRVGAGRLLVALRGASRIPRAEEAVSDRDELLRPRRVAPLRRLRGEGPAIVRPSREGGAVPRRRSPGRARPAGPSRGRTRSGEGRNRNNRRRGRPRSAAGRSHTGGHTGIGGRHIPGFGGHDGVDDGRVGLARIPPGAVILLGPDVDRHRNGNIGTGPPPPARKGNTGTGPPPPPGMGMSGLGRRRPPDRQEAQRQGESPTDRHRLPPRFPSWTLPLPGMDRAG